jgi:histone-lysine N-methyltransferase SETD8
MRAFDKNEFVVEYRGELVDGAEAEARENRYALDPDIGSYMYFFKHKERVMW